MFQYIILVVSHFGFEDRLLVLIATVLGDSLPFNFHIKVFVVVPCGGSKSLPAHPFNAVNLQSSGIVCNQFVFYCPL